MHQIGYNDWYENASVTFCDTDEKVSNILYYKRYDVKMLLGYIVL